MPISVRPDRGDVPQIGDPAFDALLARALRPEDAVASLRPVVESFEALYAAPVHGSPAAEVSALTAFRALAVPRRGTAGRRPGRPGHAGRRTARGQRDGRSTRGWARSRLAGVRLAVATAAVAAIALTAGGAAAAYAGYLPAPMQRLAHEVIGAPPAAAGRLRPDPGRPGTAARPGNAAYGRCRAYEQALAHGRSGLNPVTLRRLAAAAGGAAQVAAYCARLDPPGQPANGHPAHPQHGKPSAPATPGGPATPAAAARSHARPSQAASNHGKHTR